MTDELLKKIDDEVRQIILESVECGYPWTYVRVQGDRVWSGCGLSRSYSAAEYYGEDGCEVTMFEGGGEAGHYTLYDEDGDESVELEEYIQDQIALVRHDIKQREVYAEKVAK